MIDFVIANPAVSQGRIAQHFGYSEGWVSQVFTSDSFKARLEIRRKELVDPVILETLNAGFEAVCRQSLAVIQDNLSITKDPKLALATLQVSSKALGFGARLDPAVQVNNWFQTLTQNNVGHLSLVQKNGAGAAAVVVSPQTATPATPSSAPGPSLNPSGSTVATAAPAAILSLRGA